MIDKIPIMENVDLCVWLWTIGIFVVGSVVFTPLEGILIALVSGFFVAALIKTINRYFPDVSV